MDKAEREFRDYNEICRRIDQIYSARTNLTGSITDMGLSDQEYDTFWASMEVLKPAIYAKPPQVVAKPRYSDASATDKVVAELIERVVNSEFERSGIDLHLREVRDDLAMLNRGVLWITYEAQDGEKRICIEHLDRMDYLHEPVRYWPELGWEARCAWLTQSQMRKRFSAHSGEAYRRAGFVSRKSQNDDGVCDDSLKAPVWEVWSKADNRVYWVSEGVDEILDEGPPHLDLRGFFPGPRPAYGTLRRRSLIPVPDYIRYENHLDQINFLTGRIYGLLERIRVVGLLPAGGDVGKAMETALAENSDAMFIPVPGAAMQTGGGDFIQFLPLTDIAAAITGLIEARNQLFADFDRLSGISDIMRGETQSGETLGAQRIKTQYGSVRVKDKTDEIVRLSRDAARIAIEIICAKFDQKTLLDIAQMDIPSKRDVERDIKAIQDAAKKEIKALADQAKDAADKARQSGQQVDTEQAEQQFKQAQGQLAQKYAPQLARLQNTVVIEDVMAVIKDRRERALVIDIETDSTVMVDEMGEKQMRNELLGAFSSAVQAMMPLFQLGDAGVKLAVTMIGFTLQPYTRGNRQIEMQLEELIENAPDIAKNMAAAQGGGDGEALAEAQKGLAEAEKMKASAAMASVEAKSALDKAEMQRKIAQMQQDAQDKQNKAQQDMAALRLKADEAQSKNDLQQAQINKLTADTAKILHSIGLDERQQELAEYKASSDVEARQNDQAIAMRHHETDAQFRERGENRADRNQDFTESGAAMNSGDQSTDAGH